MINIISMIKSKFSHIKRKALLRNVDSFVDRSMRCNICNKVMFISSKKHDPKLFWVYFNLDMVCDDCFKQGTNSGAGSEFLNNIRKNAEKDFILKAKELNLLED